MTERPKMPITKPTIGADSYLDKDSEDTTPKIGTTVQQGWDAADSLLKVETSTDYPTDFRFTEDAQLVKFLEDSPFRVYEQHWIERQGKKSFVCLGEDCPLCDVLGDKPRGKFAFNVLVLSDENPTVQILTAPPTFARQIRKVHEDDRKGPLSKEYWEITRIGNGPTTQYSLTMVKGRDLAEEWKLDLDEVQELVATAVPFTAEVIRETPRSEMLEIARSIA